MTCLSHFVILSTLIFSSSYAAALDSDDQCMIWRVRCQGPYICGTAEEYRTYLSLPIPDCPVSPLDFDPFIEPEDDSCHADAAGGCSFDPEPRIELPFSCDEYCCIGGSIQQIACQYLNQCSTNDQIRCQPQVSCAHVMCAPPTESCSNGQRPILDDESDECCHYKCIPDCSMVRCAAPQCDTGETFRWKTETPECCDYECIPDCTLVRCIEPKCDIGETYRWKTETAECCDYECIPECNDILCIFPICEIGEIPRWNLDTDKCCDYECVPDCLTFICPRLICGVGQTPRWKTETPECCDYECIPDCTTVLCLYPVCEADEIHQWKTETPECCDYDCVPDCSKVLCLKPMCGFGQSARWKTETPECCDYECIPDCTTISCQKPICGIGQMPRWKTETDECCDYECIPDCSTVLCHYPVCKVGETHRWKTETPECCDYECIPDCTTVLCKFPICEVGHTLRWKTETPDCCDYECIPDCSLVRCLPPICKQGESVRWKAETPDCCDYECIPDCLTFICPKPICGIGETSRWKTETPECCDYECIPDCSTVLCQKPICGVGEKARWKTETDECCDYECIPDCSTVLCLKPICGLGQVSRWKTETPECCDYECVPDCRKISCLNPICDVGETYRWKNETPECCDYEYIPDCFNFICPKPVCDDGETPQWQFDTPECCDYECVPDCSNVICQYPVCKVGEIHRWKTETPECCDYECIPDCTTVLCQKPICEVGEVYRWKTETDECCDYECIPDCKLVLCQKPICGLGGVPRWKTETPECCDYECIPDCSTILCEKPICEEDLVVRMKTETPECCDYECIDPCADVVCAIIDCQPGWRYQVVQEADPASGICCEEGRCIPPRCLDILCESQKCPSSHVVQTSLRDDECCPHQECVYMPDPNCKRYFDGCNTCQVHENGVRCTDLDCEEMQEGKCLDGDDDECDEDGDCDEGEYCRVCRDSDDGFEAFDTLPHTCGPLLQKGEVCASMWPLCLPGKCDEGLTCTPYWQDLLGPLIMDLPSICCPELDCVCPPTHMSLPDEDGCPTCKCVELPCENAGGIAPHQMCQSGSDCESGNCHLFDDQEQTMFSGICCSQSQSQDPTICVNGKDEFGDSCECEMNNCASCTLGENGTCRQCSSSFFMVGGRCVPFALCRDGYYVNTRQQCSCSDNCVECIVTASDTKCQICRKPFYLDDDGCQRNCPENMVGIVDPASNYGGECATNIRCLNSKVKKRNSDIHHFKCKCPSGCKECRYTNSQPPTCQSCKGGKFLHEEQCITKCPDTMTNVGEEWSFRECKEEFWCTNGISSTDGSDCQCPERAGGSDCIRCHFQPGNRPRTAKCRRCKPPLVNYWGKCWDECPSGLSPNDRGRCE